MVFFPQNIFPLFEATHEYSQCLAIFFIFRISYVWDKFQELYGVALGSSGLEMLLLVTQTRTCLII